MNRTKQEVFDSFSAYSEGAFDMTKPLKASLAYKICKNMLEIKRAYRIVSTDIDALREQYGWSADGQEDAMESAAAVAYAREYDELMEETIEVNLDPIYINDLDENTTMNEMSVIYIMLVSQ